MRQSTVLIACVLSVLPAACGGGTAAPAHGVLPVVPAKPHAPASSAPTASSAPKTPSPTATSTPTPTPAAASPHVSTRIPDTNGRVGLFQVFDYRGGEMPASQIAQHARRMDAVWGSTQPAAWNSAHPGMIVSQYFIMGLDQYAVGGRGLSWWEKNHPDWIEYACTSNGTPTHDVAYMRGINVPDVPVDIHNAAADAYELQNWAQAARSKGYTALAIDQVVFWNVEIGGNPNFGQRANRSEYACGTWHGGTFTRDYSSVKDPRFEQDVVNYVALARSVAHKYGLALIVNHPSGSLSNPDERELLADTDIDLDETGFSDYGHYRSRNGEIFKTELPYIRYAQEHGTGMLLVDRFDEEKHVDSKGLEYSLATYLLGDEGGLLLFVGGANGYGTMQYHSEYDTKIGSACSAVQQSGAVYSRRFSNGFAVVNGGDSSQDFTLPSGTYRDIEGRRFSGRTLSLAANDAYVLTGGSGC